MLINFIALNENLFFVWLYSTSTDTWYDGYIICLQCGRDSHWNYRPFHHVISTHMAIIIQGHFYFFWTYSTFCKIILLLPSHVFSFLRMSAGIIKSIWQQYEALKLCCISNTKKEINPHVTTHAYYLQEQERGQSCKHP